ncbi:MAG: CYTH domain-containing protein [bacterium]
MVSRLETELKVRLEGAAAYQRVCRRLGPPADEWDQENHYYRSADGSIPGKSGVIRMRAEKGRVLFTVKLDGTLQEGLARAMEFELPWKGEGRGWPPPPESLWEVGHPGMDALAARRGGRLPLVWIGQMTNRRKTFRFSESLLLEVDASRYPDGCTDYELELETPDPDRDRALVSRRLEEAGIPYIPQVETKYQRFLRHLAT